MSGPVTAADALPVGAEPETDVPTTGAPTFERLASRSTVVGGVTVRRALPRRQRRTIGAWCFVDHFGDAASADQAPMQVGPHPHCGLHTVTWLVEGEVLHRDSLGSEQLVRPGQLNLMTAGHGVSHAEESPTGGRAALHGVQLWLAQPEATRHGPPSFAHHAELPRVELGGLVGTVLVGAVAGEASPARVDTPLLGVALTAEGDAVLPLEPSFEHGLLVLDGELDVAGQPLRPGELAYLGQGRDELALSSSRPTRALLLGGVPFGESPLMWWNFVARSRDELRQAWQDWEERSARFGEVASALERLRAPRPL